MKTKLIKRDRGFTIIEVMIVLAIAGLILAIVFLAVPSLNRSAHNNSRKNDATHLAGLVSEYASNHAGTLPTSAQLQTAATNEHWAIMSAPGANTVVVVSGSNVGVNYGDINTMYVNETANCDPSTNTITGGTGASSRSFAIGFQIETSGAPQGYCIPGS
ncbi:MAG: type II secretion system protein [Candidatus Saccharimonadales bacterium]